jgi:hypothetical protein
MKKRFLTVILSMVLVLGLIACGVSQEEYDKLLEERDRLLRESNNDPESIEESDITTTTTSLDDIRDSLKKVGTYIKDDWGESYTLNIKDKNNREKLVGLNIENNNAIEIVHFYMEFEPSFYMESISIVIRDGAEIFEYYSSIGDEVRAEGTINPKTYDVELTENDGVAEKWHSKAFIQELLLDIDKVFKENNLPYTHVDLGFAKINSSTHTEGEKSTTTTRQTTTTPRVTQAPPKRCGATPCPNNAISGSSYCSVHKDGKSKKCIQCGKAIWADEIWCDSCLFGAFF